jgi:hypothetical protein
VKMSVPGVGGGKILKLRSVVCILKIRNNINLFDDFRELANGYNNKR